MRGDLHSAFLLLGIFVVSEKASAEASIRFEAVRKFSIRLQPELDVIDIEAFVKKDHVLKFQLKCLLHTDTWCDPVGRWLAPRLPYLLLDGRCPKCTEVQEQKLADAFAYIRRDRPIVFQALWERYIKDEREEERYQENGWEEGQKEGGTTPEDYSLAGNGTETDPVTVKKEIPPSDLPEGTVIE